VHLLTLMRPSAGDGMHGFPSGHIAATTSFFLGLVFLFNWRWAWTAMAIVLPLMAVAHLYLGRLFIGDILGGFSTGVAATAMGILALVLGRLARPRISAAAARAVALRVVLVAAAFAALGWIFGIPGPYESSRFLGIAIGVMLLEYHGHVSDRATMRVRIERVALTAAIFAVVWWGVSAVLRNLGDVNSYNRALLAGALPALVLLPGAIYVSRLTAALKHRLP
jgi:hypothetical protein